jgi:hypothetical protein
MFVSRLSVFRLCHKSHAMSRISRKRSGTPSPIPTPIAMIWPLSSLIPKLVDAGEMLESGDGSAVEEVSVVVDVEEELEADVDVFEEEAEESEDRNEPVDGEEDVEVVDDGDVEVVLAVAGILTVVVLGTGATVAIIGDALVATAGPAVSATVSPTAVETDGVPQTPSLLARYSSCI